MEFQLELYNKLFIILFLSSWCSVNGQNLSKNYSSYRPNPMCTPSDYIRYPETIEDVIEIVEEAIERGVTVKVFGARHSQTDIICTEGIPIDSHKLQYFQMNDDGITATFGAGVTLRDATQFLFKHGRALKTTPQFGNITLGGAIGTGAHGSSIKYNASISSQVVGLTIVDGLARKRIISTAEDLKAFRINLGLLGIVVNVTLYTVELYKTRGYNYIVPDDILTNGVAKHYAKTTDQMTLYWFPAFKEVVVANWTNVDKETPGKAWTNDHVPTTYSIFNYIGTVLKEIAFGLTSSTCALANSLGYTVLHVIEYILELGLVSQVPLWAPIYTEDGFFVKNPAVGYYDIMTAPICYDNPKGLLQAACLWSHGPNNITILDNEFGLDLADLPNFITDIKEILRKTPTAFPLQGVIMRFSDKSDIYMSTAYGRLTVHFEFYLWNRKDRYNQPSGSLAGYQTILQMLTQKYKARSHWGKSGLVYHNSDSLNLKLDTVARSKFIDAMIEFDPNEVFINNFGRRLKKKGIKVDIDPLTTRCALLDNCFCTKNSDCGATQKCTTLNGYIYKVCKTRNEVPEVSVEKPKFALTYNGLLNYLINDLATLVTATLAKCTVNGLLDTVTKTADNTVGNLVNGLVSGVLG